MTKEFTLKVLSKYAKKHDISIEISQYQENNFVLLCDTYTNSDKIIDFLENTKINYGFSDEYTTCSDCYQIFRTCADSYHWQRDFFMGDGYIICDSCFKSTSDYIELYFQELTNNPQRANTIFSHSELEKNGYEKINMEVYQNGYFDGMSDDPRKILEKLLKENPDQEFIFSIPEVSQFYIEFDVYQKEGVDSNDN